MQGTSAFPWGNDVLRDFQFGCTGGSRADAPGSHRTGRKEKPRQDNGKKPKCAKIYRDHSWSCERKAIKGCTARIMPNHSAFRKWNDSLWWSRKFCLSENERPSIIFVRSTRHAKALDSALRTQAQGGRKASTLRGAIG